MYIYTREIERIHKITMPRKTEIGNTFIIKITVSELRLWFLKNIFLLGLRSSDK